MEPAVVTESEAYVSKAARSAIAAQRRAAAEQDERLSIPVGGRVILSTFIGGIAGFSLGAAKGSIEAGFRFRAENAHRLPQSQTGWYLYHKSKNYHAMLGGAVEGVKMAGKVSIWAIMFVGMEEATDAFRRGITRITQGDEAVDRVSKDFVSTVVAGMGTAGAFSLWNRFPVPTAARTAKAGIKAGLIFGLAQDALSLLRGRRIGYIEFLKRHTFGTRSKTIETPEAVGG